MTQVMPMMAPSGATDPTPPIQTAPGPHKRGAKMGKHVKHKKGKGRSYGRKAARG